MGAIDDLWERNDGTARPRYGQGRRYRAVPWLAATGTRGPSRMFDHRDDATAYIDKIEDADGAVRTVTGAPSPRRHRRVLFADYVADVAATMGEARNTRTNYRSMARNLAAVWPTEYLDEITHDMVEAYFARLVDDAASTSLRAKRRTVMRATMRRAIRAGHITVDPTEDVKSINQRKTRKKRPITEDEFGYLLAETPAWLRPAFLLGYDSGLRAGEMAGLHWADVDIAAGMVHIGPVMLDDGGGIKPVPKNGEPADVPMTGRTVAALTAYARRFPGQPGDLVFREPRAGGRESTTPRRIRILFDRACRMASLAAPWPHPHDLRHGCAERLAAAGVAPHVIQAVMRHRSITSTQVYLPQVGAAEMRAAMAAVPSPALDDDDADESAA